MFILIGLVVWIICLVFNVKIANKKGRKHVGAWVVFSIFLSLIALIVNAAIPKRGFKFGASQRYVRNTQRRTNQSCAGNTQRRIEQSYTGNTQGRINQSYAVNTQNRTDQIYVGNTQGRTNQIYVGNTQSRTAGSKMFCTNCGQEIKESARFCHKCGHAVSAGKTT